MATSFHTPNDLTQMIAQPYGYPTMAFSHTSNYQFPQKTSPMFNSSPYQFAVAPDRMSAYSTQSPSSFHISNQTVPLPQYNTVNYSPTNYVYPPPPPFPSNNRKIANYPTQSNATSFLYTTSMNGRISPLLGRSTILQYASNPVQDRYSHSSSNENALSKTWSQNLPSLPPGAIVVLDEYIDAKVSAERQHSPKRKQKRPRRAQKSTRRAITINPNDTRITRSIAFSSSSDTNDTQSNATSQFTSLASKTVTHSNGLPLIINSNHQTKSTDKKLSPTSSQEELRELRLKLAMSDNPVNSLPSAKEKESTHGASSPSASQWNGSTADLFTAQENNRQSPTSSQTNSRRSLNDPGDHDVDLISLTTLSRSERTLSTIDNL